MSFRTSIQWCRDQIHLYTVSSLVSLIVGLGLHIKTM